MGRCADQLVARVAARGRSGEYGGPFALQIAPVIAGRACLQARLEIDAYCLSRVSQFAGEKPVSLRGIRDRHRLRSDPSMSAPYGPFNGLIWPKTGCASTGLAQQRRHNFLPLGCAHSARNKKVLPVLSGPRHAGGAPPVVFGLSIAIGP